MKRALIFTGPARSGKTKKALEIAKELGDDKFVYISGRKADFFHHPFAFQDCTEKLNSLLLMMFHIVLIIGNLLILLRIK